MPIANRCILAAAVLAVLLIPVTAQQVHRYTDVRHVAGADDTLGHTLELTLGADGRVASAELRLYEGPAEPVVRLALKVLTSRRRLVLQGRHPERGLLTVAGTRTDEEFRGTLQKDEDTPKPLHLRRE
jgi:hypothetical protein